MQITNENNKRIIGVVRKIKKISRIAEYRIIGNIKSTLVCIIILKLDVHRHHYLISVCVIHYIVCMYTSFLIGIVPGSTDDGLAELLILVCPPHLWQA